MRPKLRTRGRRLASTDRTRPPGNEHPAIRWARDVIEGRIVAGEFIKLAVERHFRDIKVSPSDCRFSPEAGQRAIDFFGFLHHSKGEWAGQRFVLEPWEQFFVYVLFGWLTPTGTRRFRQALLEIARKNGKSTLAAGIALYLLIADGEGGAEVYAAATKRDQARIVWSEAERMVKASPGLLRRVNIVRNNMSVTATLSKFEPLGADEDSMDGLNISGAVIDELHAHKNRKMLDVIATATGARRQPLLAIITTAGSDRLSVCYEQHDYAIKVLRGVIEDDSYFAMIFALDEADDWTDPAVWAKANPNLGVSVKVDDLERKCRKAKEIAAEQNAFRRLHLNQWTEQDTRWLDLDLWDRGAIAVDVEELRGRVCFSALDLSSTTDICADVKVFPPVDEDEPWKVVCRFYVPRENIAARAKRDRVPYQQWVQDGFIEATEGNVVDYDVIRERIREDGERFDIREIAYDRWNATQLSTQLGGDGFTMVPFGQGFASMASPCREFESLLMSGRIAHAGNPVLRWMAANVSVEQDAAGNRKPSKAKSRERIDGIVALLMGIGRAIVTEGGASVYEERGILTI